MKPLDIVKTPKGAFAIVTETNREGANASISFFGGGNTTGEKSAWWYPDEGLEVVDNLAGLLAREMAHPFGSGRSDVRFFYPLTP